MCNTNKLQNMRHDMRQDSYYDPRQEMIYQSGFEADKNLRQENHEYLNPDPEEIQ